MPTNTTTTTLGRGSARATYAAAFISVALAQITNALPGALNGTFAAQFHTTGAGLTWISAVFSLGIVVFELTFGLLGDLFGRKRLLITGSALVLIGAAIAALAPSTGVMILAQAIGGLGAGILFPIGLSMVAALTPDLRARARVIATWAGFLSLGAVISPVLAGVTNSVFTVAGPTASAPDAYSGWRVSYWIAAAVALVLVLISAMARDSSAPEGRKLDLPGQATLALGLIGVLYATVDAVDAGFGAWHVIAAYVAGAVLLVVFVIIEMKAKAPLLHLSLFRNPAFSITGTVAVTGMFAFLATCFATSVAVGGLAQQPVWVIGVLFVFIQGPAFVLIPVVAWLIHQVSPRWVLTAGFVFMAASGYWLATLTLGVPEAFGGPSWTRWIIPLLLLGIGFALTVGSITAVAINAVEPSRIGMASATTNMLRDLGFALGPVVGSAIAFSLGAAAFSGPLAGILNGAGLSPDDAAGLSHVPPLGFLSGWEGVIAQVSGQAAASGAPASAVHGIVSGLTGAQAQIQGAAGVALGKGFHVVYLTAAVAAIVSAVLTVFIPGKPAAPTDGQLAETLQANEEAATEAMEA